MYTYSQVALSPQLTVINFIVDRYVCHTCKGYLSLVSLHCAILPSSKQLTPFP